jgi:heparosan-N-sulfate-glucuronate 5-epimerase
MSYSRSYSLHHILNQIILDNSGIPIVNYKNVSGVDIGAQRNPVTITHVALEAYNNYKISGNATSKQIFLNNSNWIVSNAVPHGNYSVLEYHFPWPQYNLKPPWYSAMAQARALQVLINAHEITADQKYLDTAKKLLNSFFVEVKDGGVTYKTPNDGWWYEEYAGTGGKQPMVLNGMIFSLLGIYDYYQHTNGTRAKYLFDQGVHALMKNLPRYDDIRHSYSYYDILNTTNPLRYHHLHIDLLDRLYRITNETIFMDYRDKWDNYRSPPYLVAQK